MAITRIDVDSFLKAIGEYYGDKIAPSLTTAWLPEKKVFYASLVRYQNFNNQKTVVLKAQSASSTAEAVLKLMTVWKNQVLPPPKTNLNAWLEQELPQIPNND